MTLQFSDWHSIEAAATHTGAGVYEYRLAIERRPVPIPRMLGVDNGGVLVIGRSKNVGGRSPQSRSGRKSGYGSSTMNLLYYLERHTSFLRVFPNAEYQFRFAPVGMVEEAKTWEERLLKQYLCRFGELPPLNSVIPNRYGGWEDAAAAIAEVG